MLFVGRERKAKTLLRFFRDFGKQRSERLQFVCSDMWHAYVKVIAKKASKAQKAYSMGVVEGMNRKINLVTRKSFGFRTFDVLKIALSHSMGDLPEPEFTHRFC